MKIDNCSDCDCGSQRPIVNKFFYLCDQKNKERLNAKKEPTVTKQRKTPAKFIKHSSSKQSEIERKYAIVCAEIDAERDMVCESCGRSDFPLSHSHTISRKRCKELGMPELIYDKDNLVLECYEEATSKPKRCHNIWETGNIALKLKLNTWDRKLQFIQKHDEVYARKLIMQKDEQENP